MKDVIVYTNKNYDRSRGIANVSEELRKLYTSHRLIEKRLDGNIMVYIFDKDPL